MCLCVRACQRACTHVSMQVHACKRVHTEICVYTCLHIYIYMYVCSYLHVLIHIQIDAYIYIYIYIYTHITTCMSAKAHRCTCVSILLVYRYVSTLGCGPEANPACSPPGFAEALALCECLVHRRWGALEMFLQLLRTLNPASSSRTGRHSTFYGAPIFHRRIYWLLQGCW